MSADRQISQTSLLNIVVEGLEHLSDPGGLALLVFWAGPGGGKTTFLTALKGMCSDVVLLGPWEVRTTSSDTLVQEIPAAVERAPGGKKRLLLLDDLGELLRRDEGEPFFELEREVVCPILERGDTLIVATSHAPLIQWREYDVRIRMKNMPIPPLTREEVAIWAELRQMDPQRVFALSLGYPQILAWLQRQPDLSQDQVDRRIVERFLSTLPEESRRLAEVASLFPAFDLASLRCALSAEEDSESFYGKYLERIQALIRSGLVFWDVETVGAYRFRVGVVRRLLARSFLHRHPEESIQIHRRAAAYYQREALRYAYLDRVLVSALYHTAHAYRTESPGGVCLQWVKDTLYRWKGANWDAVLRAWRTGAGDPEVVEELRDLLGAIVMRQITQLLLKAAAQAGTVIEEQVQEVW